MMFRPRDSFDQRLLHSHLSILPEPCRLRWIHDVFGNCVTLFDFDTSSTFMEVKSIIRLDHVPENAPDFQIEEHAKLHPFKYSSEQLPDLSSCMRRQFEDRDDDVRKWLRGFLSIGRKQPTGRLLMTLNEAIADGFSYVRRSAPGTQSPGRDVKVEKRKLPGFCAADDGSGQVNGVRCPVCDRIHLCSRQGWPRVARRRLYPCVVPSVLARFRMGRI